MALRPFVLASALLLGGPVMASATTEYTPPINGPGGFYCSLLNVGSTTINVSIDVCDVSGCGKSGGNSQVKPLGTALIGGDCPTISGKHFCTNEACVFRTSA